MQLVIGVGLPASGKTTFLTELKDKILKDRKNTVSYVDFDSCQDLYDSDVAINIIDGLFLTNNDVIKLVEKWSDATNLILDSKNDEIIIHYWAPDIELCLHNDKGRRNKDSTITIKNAVMEKINTDLIIKTLNDKITEKYKDYRDEYKQFYKCKISVEKHAIVKKSSENLFFDRCGVSHHNTILCSNKWCGGGYSQDAWGGVSSICAEKPMEFTKFNDLVEELCPNISLAQYRKIWNQVVKLKTEEESDYYGGRNFEYYYTCNIKELYQVMKNMNLISNT